MSVVSGTMALRTDFRIVTNDRTHESFPLGCTDNIYCFSGTEDSYVNFSTQLQISKFAVANFLDKSFWSSVCFRSMSGFTFCAACFFNIFKT